MGSFTSYGIPGALLRLRRNRTPFIACSSLLSSLRDENRLHARPLSPAVEPDLSRSLFFFISCRCAAIIGGEKRLGTFFGSGAKIAG
jgi:hypothetical protein